MILGWRPFCTVPDVQDTHNTLIFLLLRLDNVEQQPIDLTTAPLGRAIVEETAYFDIISVAFRGDRISAGQRRQFSRGEEQSLIPADCVVKPHSF